MTYSKPEVKTLGEARMIIQAPPHQKIPGSPTDGVPLKVTNPAYDLDE
ncbi:MAG: hypothetical protein WCF26_07900 [Candidatus Sulfotelmatobacter sp.]